MRRSINSHRSMQLKIIRNIFSWSEIVLFTSVYLHNWQRLFERHVHIAAPKLRGNRDTYTSFCLKFEILFENLLNRTPSRTCDIAFIHFEGWKVTKLFFCDCLRRSRNQKSLQRWIFSFFFAIKTIENILNKIKWKLSLTYARYLGRVISRDNVSCL